MITKFSHMTIYVKDQKRAFDVYVNKLGFKVANDMTMDNGFRWLTVSPPGADGFEILLAEPKSPMVDAELVPYFEKLLEANALGGAVIECDDCRKTYETLKGKGIEFMKPPTKEFYGVEALFKDGCGNWYSLTDHTQG